MNLVAGTLAMSNGLTTFFLGTGGVEPYVYSITPGGVGGSIDADTGEYTAPATGIGTDIIVATDDDGDTASQTMLVGTALELFCDIIRTELNLNQDQIWLWDQKIFIPKDERLYVAVSILTCKPFGNTMRPSSVSMGGLNADQSANMMATLSVDILSRSLQAVHRKEEVVLALASVYAEQQQELNSFSIGRLPVGFVNLSQIDGAAIPYRFNISINMQYMFKKVKAIDYFDDYPDLEVDTNP